MFKLKKNKSGILFFIIIITFMLYLSITMYKYICKTNNNISNELDNVEGFNIRQYYNSKKRNFNKVKNQYLRDGKIKMQKFLKKNNII